MNTGRPIEIRIVLNDEQRSELRRLARTAIGRVSERAHFVLLSDQGKSVPEIGAVMGYSAQAVYPWLARYQQQGVAGLYDEPRSGRPPNAPHLAAIVQTQTGQPPECHLAGDNIPGARGIGDHWFAGDWVPGIRGR